MTEYEMLREETMDNIRAITQYTVILYAAITAVFAFAIESDSFLLYLTTYIIILPLHFATESKLNANCKIAAYLYVFLEGGEFNWERRHQQLEVDNSYKRNWKSHFFYYAFLIISSIAAEYNLLADNDTCATKWVWGVAIPVLFVIVIWIMRKTSVNYTQAREKFISQWQALKNAEDAAASKAACAETGPAAPSRPAALFCKQCGAKLAPTRRSARNAGHPCQTARQNARAAVTHLNVPANSAPGAV